MIVSKYRNIFNSLFTATERFQIWLMVMSTTLHGLLQVVGIASIMPFIAVVTNPELVTSNQYLHWLYTAMEFSDTQSFLIFLGAGAFVMLIFSNAVTTISYWFTLRFCNHLEHDLACRLLASYLDKPYEFFLEKNTAELSKVILSEVQRVVSGILLATIGIISDVVLTIFIVALLVLIDPWVTLTTFLSLATAYGLIFLAIQSRVSRLGREFVRLNALIFTRAREALESVKEIKVLGRRRYFVDNYAKHSLQAARNSVSYRTMSLLPTQSLEAVAFGGIIGITLYFMISHGSTGDSLALVAMYAFAAYRLLPAMKDIFEGVETIRYNAAALDELLDDYDANGEQPELKDIPGSELQLSRMVEVVDASYRYPGQHVPALERLHVEIPALASTCFMGDSGAGKSTTLEVILGLLRLQSGEVRIDDVALNAHNLSTWQRQIGYVPQVVYLTDESIRRNIAFGVDEEEIDADRLKKAAKLAGILDFIVNDLSEGFDTVVGERGLSISGGQRQRLGIARALYHDPAVLVLDEATNELDALTESTLLERLLALSGKTFIFVSHRASLARRCDQIVLFRSGHASVSGSYSQLLATSAYFRELVSERTADTSQSAAGL